VRRAGRTFRAQIAVRSVSVESYNSVSEYCGRVSPSELSFSRALQFSGLDNIVRRAHHPRAHSSVGLVLQLGSSCYCIRFFCLLYLLYSTFYSPHIYTHIPNWFSPGGFYPGSC
jgi:hypothetical protein